MQKILGVLATIAVVGAAALTAPAPAEARGRGIGPGLAFGLAAGAIAAGAAASSPYYYGPRLRPLRSELLLRAGTVRLLRQAVLSTPLLQPMVTRKARSDAPGFFVAE